jgi:RNA polymerase sigma-70 factor (sigma-E family)
MTAYDEFFAEHYDEVVRTLALAVGDRQRAEDAAQEAFARAFRRWGAVSRMDRPVGWVIVVGVNQMKRWITRVDRRDEEHAASLAHGDPNRADPPDPAEQVATGTTLRAALDRLGPRQRATVVLRILCDLSTEDVASALGCSTGTVKSALHAALGNLRVDLGDWDPDREPARPVSAPAVPVSGKEAPRHAHR